MIEIYCLIDPRSGHVKYVGKAKSAKSRYRNHICNTKSKSYKSNWIRNLKLEELKPELLILDSVKESEWIFWEQHYISLFKSYGFILTNGTFGGDDPGYKLLNKNNNRKGCSLTQEHKNKIKIATTKRMTGLKGIKHPKFNKPNKSQMKQVVELNKEGKIINSFVSVQECHRQTGISAVGISDVCKNKVKKVYNRIFAFTTNN